MSTARLQIEIDTLLVKIERAKENRVLTRAEVRDAAVDFIERHGKDLISALQQLDVAPERYSYRHPHTMLKLTRSIAPDKYWHWTVEMPDGHMFACSAPTLGGLSFDQALADMNTTGVHWLKQADRIWRTQRGLVPLEES